MEYLIFGIVLFFLMVFLMLNGYLDHKKKEKRFIRKLHEEYGQLLPKEYKPERFRTISGYYKKHPEEFHVDDITWNDLSMDEVFKSMNGTYSAAGEEYLYYLLRTPCVDEEELLRREKIISWFSEHEKERVAYQFIYSKLGNSGKFSVYDYLDYLDDLGERSNFRHYLAVICILLSIGLIFVNVPLGLLALVLVLIINNLTYFKIKEQIDPYVTSFAYIFRLLYTIDAIKKYPVDILEEEMKELLYCRRLMTGFKAGSSLVMSAGRMSGSGNPLEIFVDFLRMGFHLDLIKFNQMLYEVRKHLTEIDRMITLLGRIEAMIVIGAYRKGKDHCVPEFTGALQIQAEGMYHPLIGQPVRNDIDTGKSVLITGSNASGKSTFLKTVAINAILAQTIHTCPAKSYKAPMFYICSSMALRDDVQGGDSYYMVEIKALKRILDVLNRKMTVPVLCLVDEVLRGTNTVERIAASTEILRSMAEKNCICFAATHDIELTHLLEEAYHNYHFAEEIAGDDISFTYRILEGRADTRNAIRLLGMMGYQETVVRRAEERAQTFLTTGKWCGLDLQKA